MSPSESLLSTAPMLAAQSKEVASDPSTAVERLIERGWVFDVKWDGVRCIAYVTGGQVKLRNRRGRDITFRYPDVVANLAATFGDRTVALDGELVAFDTLGKPSFTLTARRDGIESDQKAKIVAPQIPVTFIAFDLLFDGNDLRDTALLARLALLKATVPATAPGMLVSTSSTDGATLWTFAQQHDLEGLIAKDPVSLYRPGRSKSWVKLKTTKTATFRAYGFEEGEGSCEGMVGALLLDVLDANGRWVPVGKVGTGFTHKERQQLTALMDGGVKPLVEVEYQEVTADGVLRFPSYKGRRLDVDEAAATFDQLT